MLLITHNDYKYAFTLQLLCFGVFTDVTALCPLYYNRLLLLPHGLQLAII